jgi:signal transduction histidine kinase
MASFLETIVRVRQGLLLAACFAVLILIGTGVLWLVTQAADNARQVERTLKVQDQLSNVLLSLRRAEAGQRGYLFTNETSYLEDYQAARPEANATIDELANLQGDDAARAAMIAKLKKLVAEKFDEMDRTIELNSSGRREDARAIVLGGRGRVIMNDLRDTVESAIAAEGALLSQRARVNQHNNVLLLILTLAGTAFILAIGALSVYLVQRNARAREKAQRELAGTNANLERIVEYRTADLREANDEIQRFAYIVSHDLRSPLVNIMGFTTELEALRADLFERVTQLRQQLDALNAQAAAPQDGSGEQTSIEQLGSDFDEAIGFIKTSIAKMDRLINAVLKLSREGRREFRPETIDMKALLNSVAETVAHRAIELGATVTIGDLPQVESDRLALEQVFSNLVDNALKYLRDDEPGRIEVVGRSNAAQSIYEVRDNGRGIEPGDHQRVFELFRRSGRQDRPGEGIGLAHVRALVRRLGGHMSLSSELGKGSVFTVTLPRYWSAQTRSVA